MKSAAKQVYYQSWKQVCSAVNQLVSDPHRSNSHIDTIVCSALGSSTRKGLIASRINRYYEKSPAVWADEVQTIVKVFSPDSPLFNSSLGIVATAEYEVMIEGSMLPRFVLSQSGESRKQPTLIYGLKMKQGSTKVPMWQWFWIHLAYALLNLPELPETRSLEDEEAEDDMFYFLTRNPYLLIAHKALTWPGLKGRPSQLFERMRSIFQLYFIDDVQKSLESISNEVQSRYQFKMSHLGLVFLLISIRKSDLEGSRLQTYHQYFLNATKLFDKVTPQNHYHRNFAALIRCWILLITREHSLDHHITTHLQYANPIDKFYRLQRCPLKNWLHAAKNTHIPNSQALNATAVRINIFHQLQKLAHWRPCFNFLAQLEVFTEFDKTVLARFLKQIFPKNLENQAISRCFQKTLTQLTESGADGRLLEQTQARLNKNFYYSWHKKINIKFTELRDEVMQKQAKIIQEGKPISFKTTRPKNVWEYGMQEGESEWLLNLSRWVANKIDRIFSGHQKRQYPCINLRFFANPYLSALFFLLVTIFLWRIVAIYILGSDDDM